MSAAFAEDSPVLTGVVAASKAERLTAPYRTRSAEFVKCLQKRVQYVQNPEWQQDILDEILITLDYINQ